MHAARRLLAKERNEITGHDRTERSLQGTFTLTNERRKLLKKDLEKADAKRLLKLVCSH